MKPTQASTEAKIPQFNTEPITIGYQTFQPGEVELYGSLKIVRDEHTIKVGVRAGETFPSLRIWRGRQRMPFVNAFFPTRQKPLLPSHPQFDALTRRQDAIDEAKRSEDRIIARKQERQSERKEATNPFEVGDMLSNTWGYDQTNVDFYQVVAKTAKTVTIRAIGGERTTDSEVRPMKDAFLKNSPPMVKHVLSSRPVLSMEFGIATRTSGEGHYVTPWYAGH